MTPERWRQIEALYNSAREHGLAVLEGTDPDLRREVEQLLAQDSTGKLLDRHASDVLAELTVTQQPVEAPADLIGRKVAQYEILEKLGAGGMGVVYKARDTRLNRLVALKFLPPQLRHDADLKRRLAQEARAASALDHPNIVVIHDILEDGDDLFVAMAFHEGATLKERITGPMPVEEALRIARQVAAGLARAHEHSIVHRDIKPSNIVLAKDEVVRVIDFGLAKSVESTANVEAGIRGTPLYMSPEQASGKPVDGRTDLWSLGVVLYEMLAGTPPFRGANVFELMRAIVQDTPPRLRDLRPELPEQVEAIVARAMEKDAGKRYQTAAEFGKDLAAEVASLEAPPPVPERGRRIYPAVAAVLLVAVSVTAWFYQRSRRQLQARGAIPEIVRLIDQKKALSAHQLLQETERALPGDPQLAQLAEGLTHEATVKSTPPGATVEIKDYLSPEDKWLTLGTTPLQNVKLASGALRWRVSKPGMRVYEGAPLERDIMGFTREYEFVLEEEAKTPKDMVTVPATKYQDYIFALGDLGPYDLPSYYIDRFEVTNRQFQEFVDAGGYQKREYWKEKFVRDGRELTWDQAMELLRDSTGRAGPATWTAGRYPEGQADYPVGGVSWYEAAAYAEFAGKSLPVIAQWFRAAPSPQAKFIVALSNFTSGPAPVGKFQGVGPWGTYDMAGNMAEWCWNEAANGSRYQLGSGFGTSNNEYVLPGSLPPFHRGANAGFRCVRNRGPIPKEALATKRLVVQNFSKAKPVSDEIFRIYRNMYSYDRAPLNPKMENVRQDSPLWRKEKVVIDAAYGKERLPVYLFLPTRVRPPYQVVVFAPTARATLLPSSEYLTDMRFIDYVIQSGRAVVYPVYKGTYERTAPQATPDTVAGRDAAIQESKDIGRAIDYVETRKDLDAKRIAFMGVSWSAAMGVIYAAVEERFKAVIFLDGGFFAEKQLPGSDQADFAPRLKVPTLLISGKFDWIFMGKDALMSLLGTPPADKKAVMFETSHDVGEQREELIREVLGWLDRYLGKVQ